MEEFRRILVFAKTDCGNGSGSSLYGKDFCQINDRQWNGSGFPLNDEPSQLRNLRGAKIIFGGDALDSMFSNGKGVGKGV